MCERTRSSSRLYCSSAGRPASRCDSADLDCAAASESPTWRRAGPEINSLNIGGSVPAVDFARSAARSIRAGTRKGSSTTSAVSNKPSASGTVIARMPSRPSRAKSRLLQVASQIACLLPQTPAQRDAGQSVGATMGHQRVQERVGRRVVGLTRGADQPRHRRERHERREAMVRASGREGAARHPLWPATRYPPVQASAR